MAHNVSNSMECRRGSNAGKALRYLTLILALICSTARAGNGENSATAPPGKNKLETFQRFVNGEIPIREAIVYREIIKPDGKLLNQEWWRFGLQENTWFVERLHPDKINHEKLVPLDHHEVFGASYSNLWCVNDTDINLAPKEYAAGGVPDVHGKFPRSLMVQALSLGIPRLFEVRNLSEAFIQWNGPQFRTLIQTNAVKKGVAPLTAVLEGSLDLGTNGLPIGAEIPAMGAFPGGDVKYTYTPDNPNIPTTFSFSLPKYMRIQIEFVSLDLGSTDLTSSGGYIPSQFANLQFERHVTLWTNRLAYSLIAGKLQPAFGATNIVGRGPKRTGLFLMILMAVVSAAIIALLIGARSGDKTSMKS